MYGDLGFFISTGRLVVKIFDSNSIKPKKLDESQNNFIFVSIGEICQLELFLFHFPANLSEATHINRK